MGFRCRLCSGLRWRGCRLFFGISPRVMRKEERRRDLGNLTICGCGCGCAKDGGGYRFGIGWCDGLSDRTRDDVC